MADPQAYSIEVLSSEVIDQIAAGEVVERPAHLVKELVENSLDAGATEMTVEFDEGGRFVKVTDNGTGILPQDLSKALDRHATSKIRLSSDLFRLSSYGFRGEALASIAAVSRLTLISKTAASPQAYRLCSDFGFRSGVEQIGGSQGTSVIVEKLFDNVPARLKFMKSEAAESSRIKTTLKAIALSHPQVSIKIIQGGELLYYWPACSHRVDRAKQVLGLERLYEGFAERGDVKAHVVFADPKTVQKTAKDLWFFAQNRWIQDRGLQAAVMEAYRHLLMHGEYPVAIVWVETSPENIDVNIHPTKSQVKFLDGSLVFRAVQASLRDVLETAPWIPQPSVSTANSGAEMVTPDHQVEIPENLRFASQDFDRAQFAQKSLFVKEPVRSYSAAIPELSPRPTPALSESGASAYWGQLQILGQSNLTYILTQTADALVIVDQHAAHERVMFEKLMVAWRGGRIEVQEFLFPLALDLTAEKVEVLLQEKDQIAKLGISLEALGPETLGVRAAPLILKESAIVSVLEKMAFELIENGGSFSLERKIGDLVATMACHSAIRAGQSLSHEEMKALLQSMDQFPQSGFCPHGRPVSVEYSFYKLEKDFGRIV